MNKPLLALCAVILFAISSSGQSVAPGSDTALPYSPSLDVNSMDRSIDPCVDFYHYSCGGWQKKNPIPADQTSWSVYGKLYEDNLNFLRTILEEAALAKVKRDSVNQKIGDFYAACMDEDGAEKRGLSGVQSDLNAISQLHSANDLTALIARLQLTYGRGILFNAGSG